MRHGSDIYSIVNCLFYPLLENRNALTVCVWVEHLYLMTFVMAQTNANSELTERLNATLSSDARWRTRHGGLNKVMMKIIRMATLVPTLTFQTFQ